MSIVSIIRNNPADLHSYIHRAVCCVNTFQGILYFLTILTNRFCLPISRLFSCSVIGVALKGAIQTIIGTKTDSTSYPGYLLMGTDLVFLYMKLLFNSTCLMIHSSIIIVLYIHDIVQYCRWMLIHSKYFQYSSKIFEQTVNFYLSEISVLCLILTVTMNKIMYLIACY